NCPLCALAARRADLRPFLETMPVPCLDAGVLGFQGKSGFDDEVQHGLVAEAKINRVVIPHGVELREFDNFAFESFKAVEVTTPTVAASSGFARLAGLGLDLRRGSFTGGNNGFGCGVSAASALRGGKRAFTFKCSHLCLLEGNF